MYSVDSLEYAVERLFQDGIEENGYTDEEVRKLLERIDYAALLQAVRHRAQTVYIYTTQGRAPKSFNYRSAELFGQRATLLYEDFDQSTAAGVLTSRTYELWLLEDMSFAVAVCVSLDCKNGEYVTAYREIKEGGPWETGICLDLEELTEKLTELCSLSFEGSIPVYEL